MIYFLSITPLIRLGISISLICSLTGCAADYLNATYSIQADSRDDGQNAHFLDFRYYAGSTIVESPDDYQIKQGIHLTGTSIHGPMPRGTSLYAKWKDEDSGKTYEDTADLTSKLRGDLSGKTVYFMIYGSQLYVFLISEEQRTEGVSEIGPKFLRTHYVTQIYPDGKQPSLAREIK